uniref:Clu domain-containing protein n=1 Tax=Arcella intermedia TaxID=1963864 RepID=A0A6B2KXZ1_9EUKA
MMDWEDSLKKYEELSKLADSFVSTANYLGKTIIFERNLANKHKTIKPVNIGGIHGGEKFIEQGILFKYCNDTHMLLGYDRPDFRAANKIGGNELRGANLIFSCGISELNIPFLSLVDFNGYRLLASSLCPISNDTLKYGSSGKSGGVHFDEYISKLMAEVGRILNIAEHTVQNVKIIGPGDIEVHQFVGKHYVIDCGRIIPPQPPDHDPKSYLYKVFRPELVKGLPEPLSSDAFCRGFMTNKEEDIKFQRRSNEAMERLDLKMKEFAKSLTNNKQFELDLTQSQGQLCTAMHQFGINLRFMGKLREYHRLTTNAISVQTFFLTEITARTFKSKINEELRDIKEIQNTEDLKEVIVKYLNYILAPATENNFWKKTVKILIKEKFEGKPLSEVEDHPDNPLSKNLSLTALFKRLINLCNLKIKTDVYLKCENRLKEGKDFVLIHLDLEELPSKIKFLGVIDYIFGMRELKIINRKCAGVRRRLENAITKFQEAESKCYINCKTRNALTYATMEYLKRKWDNQIFQSLRYIALHNNPYLKQDAELFVELEILLLITNQESLLESNRKVKEIVKAAEDIANDKVLGWIERNLVGVWESCLSSFGYFQQIISVFATLFFQFISKRYNVAYAYLAYCMNSINLERYNLSLAEIQKIVQEEEMETVYGPFCKEDLNIIENILKAMILEHKFDTKGVYGIPRPCWQYRIANCYWYSYDKHSSNLIEEEYKKLPKQPLPEPPEIEEESRPPPEETLTIPTTLPKGCGEFLLPWRKGMPVVINHSGYTINLANMTQTNRDSGFRRKIRRTHSLVDLKNVFWVFCVYRTKRFIDHFKLEHQISPAVYWPFENVLYRFNNRQ